MAEFLVTLADFDRRQLWISLGYSSLFDYLHRELALSKGAAFYRLTAARLVQAHPQVIEPLRDGRLCLSSVAQLAKVLTAENRDEVIPRFFHLSKREAQEVRAELLPEPVVPRRVLVTAVAASSAPVATAAVSGPDARFAEAACGDGGGAAGPEPRCLDSRHPVHPGEPNAPAIRWFVVEPKTAELRRVHLTVSRRLLDKLAAARDALSHSHPGASEEAILEVGLDLILQRHAKRRGLVEKPRKKEAPPAPTPAKTSATAAERSRYVPAEVRREVWKRDGGCCVWPLEGGGICGSTYQVELDHIDGFARGAPTTVEACRLLCRTHQDFSARRIYGDDHMNEFTRPKGGGRSEPIAPYEPWQPCVNAESAPPNSDRQSGAGTLSSRSSRACSRIDQGARRPRAGVPPR